MIFDTHCHLNSEELYPRIDEVVESANKAGVDRFLVVGWDKESSLLAINIAKKYKCCYAAIGFHPCNIFDVSDKDFDDLMNLYSETKVVAIGEIGLDYHWVKDPRDRERQKEWFIKQIKFANDHHLPVSIHNRDAFYDCLNILKENKPIYGGIMHCYSGSVESMREVLELGLKIGIGGTLTFANAKTPKEVCEEIPLESLVLETDAPYLSPHPLRGTINEPKNIALVLDEIANIKGISKKHIADVIYKNSLDVFGIKDE